MKSSGLMGGLYVLSEWIMRLSVINLLWLFFNLPIVFIVINVLFVEQLGDIFLLITPLIVLIPLLFFPATAAMFASARDWVMNKDDKGLIKSYWSYYKENYKRSLLGGIFLTVVWLIWAIDYYYFSQENIVLMFAFLILGALLLVFTINFFSVTVHYNMKLGAILKNTLLITIGSPILFFTVLIGSGLILLISINSLQFLIPFFAGSMIAFISFSAFYRLYFKITSTNKNNK